MQQIYKNDATLQKLYEQEKKLQERIKKRKIKIAKHRQVVSASVKKLRCREHDKRLKVSGSVDGSDIIIAWQGYRIDAKEFYTYACGDSTDRVEAYDCPACGVVLGTYQVEAYKLKSQSLRQKGARAGYFIKCAVCDTLIGFGARGAFGEVQIK